jgi:hypothetical protein
MIGRLMRAKSTDTLALWLGAGIGVVGGCEESRLDR